MFQVMIQVHNRHMSISVYVFQVMIQFHNRHMSISVYVFQVMIQFHNRTHVHLCVCVSGDDSGSQQTHVHLSAYLCMCFTTDMCPSLCISLYVFQVMIQVHNRHMSISLYLSVCFR